MLLVLVVMVMMMMIMIVMIVIIMIMIMIGVVRSTTIGSVLGLLLLQLSGKMQCAVTGQNQ